MGTVLLVLFIFMVAMAVAFGVILGLIGWRLNKMNRVDPRVSSPAPLIWLVSPSQSAQLHRRLRAAAALASAATPTGTKGQGSLDHLHAQAVQQARELDRLVAVTARAPRRVRRDHLQALRPQVTELESLSGRLMGLDHRSLGARPPGTPVDPPAVVMQEMAERIAHLEHAEAELAKVERANGLLDAETVIAQRRPTLGRPDQADRIPEMPDATVDPTAATEPERQPAAARRTDSPPRPRPRPAAG